MDYKGNMRGYTTRNRKYQEQEKDRGRGGRKGEKKGHEKRKGNDR